MHPVNLLSATEATKRIRDMANNGAAHDDYSLPLAVENLCAGRPAFWSKPFDGNDTACNFFRAANEMASIKGAIDACEGFYRHSKPGTWRAAWLLDQLLPLNEQAVRELCDAYEAIGSFYTPYELLRRTAKFDRSYLPTINATHEAA